MNGMLKLPFWSMVAALLATAPAAHAEKSLLRLVVDGPIIEAPLPGAELMELFGGGTPASLHSLLKTIDRAAKDNEVHGMVLIIEQPQFALAQVEELARAIQTFRETGKKVHCYLDGAGNGSYALATAATDITLAPHASLDVVGLNAELMYYKGLFEKLGVTAHMVHCGAYKSAMEPYVRSEPSPEAAENINWLLDGIYGRWLELIASNRKLSTEDVEQLVDQAPLMSDVALKGGLIDRVEGFPAFKQRMEKEYGKDVSVKKRYKKKSPFDLDPNNPFAIFSVFSDLMEKASEPRKPGVALIYIEGPIVVGSQEASPFAGQTAGSTTIRAAFEAARNDDQIKAVVCRVNSPGGSAIASDIIWDAATRCAAQKPLIVSMGAVAGSGGYYVAIPGDTIYAEASTITGSIGVVGGKLALGNAMNEKLGITVTQFKRGDNADLFSAMTPWTAADEAEVQQMLDKIYDQFKGRVMESRGKRIKGDLDELAGGRVYTGTQAVERGLIDQIGGLADALKRAAEKANLGTDYEVYVLPKEPDFADILKKLSGEETEDEWEFAHASLFRAPQLSWLDLAQPLLNALAPQQRALLGQALQNLLILQRERAACFMPTVLSVN